MGDKTKKIPAYEVVKTERGFCITRKGAREDELKTVVRLVEYAVDVCNAGDPEDQVVGSFLAIMDRLNRDAFGRRRTSSLPGLGKTGW